MADRTKRQLAWAICLSVTWLDSVGSLAISQRDPWLCVLASRPVCLCREFRVPEVSQIISSASETYLTKPQCPENNRQRIRTHSTERRQTTDALNLRTVPRTQIGHARCKHHQTGYQAHAHWKAVELRTTDGAEDAERRRWLNLQNFVRLPNWTYTCIDARRHVKNCATARHR